MELTVTRNNDPLAGVKVYLFSESGSYLGIYLVTDAEGKVSFTLPEGQNYQFRADTQGSQYWNDTVTIQDGGSTVQLATGGGILSVNLAESPGHPLTGIKTYLFSESGSFSEFP